jgi:4-alpha-glucanotransferase
MSRRPHLRALARELGVEDGYRSALSGRWTATRDATREALVEAMGFAASSESSARASLARVAELVRGRAPAPRAPDRGAALSAREVFGEACGFGIWTNLYTVRSAANLGCGNTGDLERLVEVAAAQGAAFVGTNPLHATTHRAGLFCPYTPVSRLFGDALYLDPMRIPELAVTTAARNRLASPGWRAEAERLRAAPRLAPQAVASALAKILDPLHAAFAAGAGSRADARRRAFADYCEAQGRDLRDFTAFLALADHFERDGRGRDWRHWPAAYQCSDAPAVAAFAAQHRAEIERHAWTQFELDRQLGLAAGAARRAGLALGLYTDLALGSDGGGSDTWSRPELFVRGVHVGAPPDAFAPDGQDWSFPPLDPHALQRESFGFWKRLLDANLRHAGALRIDHALGLRRLFWIPAGRPASEGAYVRYPEREFFAGLAAASHKHRALLVAEDLGTVPEGFSQAIRRRGLLSSRVLLFERDARGFRPGSRYPRACLATANTHDLPPLAAWQGDADLVLRRRVGQIRDDAALEAARRERRRDRAALRDRLVRSGFAAREEDSTAWAAAVTAFLCETRAVLVGVALDDLGAESEPVNLPGVPADRHPSWTRRMTLSLDAIFASPHARAQLAAIPAARRSKSQRAGPLS